MLGMALLACAHHLARQAGDLVSIQAFPLCTLDDLRPALTKVGTQRLHGGGIVFAQLRQLCRNGIAHHGRSGRSHGSISSGNSGNSGNSGGILLDHERGRVWDAGGGVERAAFTEQSHQ